MLGLKQIKRTSAWLMVLILCISTFGPVGFADNASVHPQVYPAPSAVRQLSGDYSTSTAYGSGMEKYLTVYQEYNDLAIASSIRGQFLDLDGNKVGFDFAIASISRNMPENPFVIYNDKDDNFLVVWNDGISTARRIYGVLIDMDGKKLTDTMMFDPDLGPFESHDSPRAAYNPVTNTYAIVWNVRNEFQVVLDGVLVNNVLEEAVPIALDNVEADAFDVDYNPSARNFIIAAQYGAMGSEVLKSVIVQVTGSTSMGSTVVPGLTKIGSPMSVYNTLKKEEYMIWRHVNDGKHYLLGRYRKSSDPVVEFSANLLDDTKTLDTGINPDGTMLVGWSESVGALGYIYVMPMFSNGSMMDEEPTILAEIEGYFTDLSVVYNDESEKYIISYVKHKKLGNPELAVRTFPLDPALNMDGVTETESANNVDTLTEDVTNTLTNAEDGFVQDEIEKVFEVIETNLGNIEEEKTLVPALENYLEAVPALGTAAQDITNRDFVEGKLVDMAGVLTQSIQKIEDKENIQDLTNQFIENVNEVHDSGLDQTTELNVSVGDFAQGVIDKISEVEPEFETKPVGGKTQVLFDAESLQEQVTETAEAFNNVTDAFEGYYGDENVREFELKITLSTERVADDVQVPLGKELVDQLSGAAVDQVGVKVGGTQLILDDAIIQANVNEDSELLVDMGFDDQTFENPQEDITFKSGYTTEVEIFVDGEVKKVLDEPVELSFELDKFEFFDEQYNPSLISVFRFNENTGEWEPVGGVYDPVTNTVSTSRLTLSQYTVMQSNKSFNDVDTSWAKAEINELLGKGVIDETDNFNPEEAITREEFTTWVTRAYGLTNPEAEAPFEDIPADNTHATEIASAYAKGIISGSSPTTFNPDGNMTKEQMTVILANAMIAYDNKKVNEGLTDTLTAYRDNEDLAGWAADEMALMIELGVVQVGDRGILPQDTVTKEMAASIIKKIKG